MRGLRWRAALGAVALAVLVGLSGQASAQEERQPVTVVAHVDGDTLKVQRQDGAVVTVRLIGIDTPETRHPTKPVGCYGPEASARIKELAPIASPLLLERDVQELDRYGRTLGYLWTADGAAMVNEQLIGQGFAVLLTIPPDVKHVERFTAAQQSARDQALGLWSACLGLEPQPADDAVAEDVPAPAAEQVAPVLPPAVAENCHPSYPDFCIPPGPPDVNCTSDVIKGRKDFRVKQPDPHGLDRNKDGIGCESTRR